MEISIVKLKSSAAKVLEESCSDKGRGVFPFKLPVYCLVFRPTGKLFLTLVFLLLEFLLKLG